MLIFFASNALYPIDAFPDFLRVMSTYNPMTYLINGIRYFVIGPDFVAIGRHFTYTPGDILVSYIGLIVFTVLMFILAWWRFRKAIVT